MDEKWKNGMGFFLLKEEKKERKSE